MRRNTAEPEQIRKKIYKAEKKECDGRPYSFAYKLPPYGVAVFEF